MNNVENLIRESINAKTALLKKDYIRTIEEMGKNMINTFKNGKKLLIAGNGGSVADAQHFAAEMVGLVDSKKRNSKALPALALSTNASIITAVGNDMGFDNIFSRQIEALGEKGDTFVGITTSGASTNIINALKSAKVKGLVTIGFLGKDGGEAKNHCDLSLIVPSTNTQRIQECHILIIHILSELIDNAFYE